MSSFNEGSVIAKLTTLKHTQESIQGVSMYLLHHRKFSHKIANAWLKEITKERKPARLLNLFYLANDLLQNCRKKWPKYLDDFFNVLPDGLSHIARCADKKTLQSIQRTLSVWRERGVYKVKQIDAFTYAVSSQLASTLLDVWKEGGGDDPMAPRSPDVSVTPPPNEKRPPAESVASTTPTKRRRLSNAADKMDLSAPTVDNTPALSTDQVLEALAVLEQPSAADAETREKISQYPAEIANPDGVNDVRSEIQARGLLDTINEAQPVVEQYNERLGTEYDHRVNTQRLLLDFSKQVASKASVIDAMREKCTALRDMIVEQIAEAESIVGQLPDLNLLPTVGIVPLPSAADLFQMKKKKK